MTKNLLSLPSNRKAGPVNFQASIRAPVGIMHSKRRLVTGPNIQ